MATVCGLRCYDENGNVTLDVTDRICKYVGTGATGLENGSIQNDLLKGKSFPWIVPIGLYFEAGNLDLSNYTIPNFTFDSTTGTISWTFYDSFALKLGYEFIYGVY